MKRLTSTQAFNVLKTAKDLMGDTPMVYVGEKREHMRKAPLYRYDELPLTYAQYNLLLETVKEMLGHKRKQLKPYFTMQYQGKPYWMDKPYFCFKELLVDIYGDSWYFDDDCLVQGDKTIMRVNTRVSFRRMINEVQAALPATIEISK
jgi:hypothetical protein